MKLKLWGVRGSLPVAHSPEETSSRLTELSEELIKATSGGQSVEAFLESLPAWKLAGYGGETTCYDIHHGKTQVVIDGGTGIRRLGDELMSGPCGKGKGELHIVFTHFHWDHTMGIPFFKPIYVPGNKVHLYSVQPELKEMMYTIFKKPFFPVTFDDLGANIEFHQLPPRKPLQIGDLSVTPYLLDHPDPCYGLKVSNGKKNLAICTDTETIRKSPDEMGDDLPLYQDLDVLIYDAQYTLDEMADKINWGHSAGPIGIDIGMREKIKRILFVHHDPGANDERIMQAEEETRSYYEKKMKALSAGGQEVHNIEWSFAVEGEEIQL